MRKIIIQLSFSLFTIGITNVLYGQADKGILNWYNTSKAGMHTESAYKIVKNRSSQTVVVGIVDSGIDIEHEDLKGKIWTNTDEIPGNGIDDDNNGYIDDVHGWGFLGSPDGKNQKFARLEKTRIYAKYKDEFEGKEAASIPADRMSDYEVWTSAKSSMEEDKTKYEGYKVQSAQLPMLMQMIPQMVSAQIGKEDYTVKDLKKWKPKDEQAKQIKTFALAIKNGDITQEVIDEQMEQINDMLSYYLESNYNDREFIGDDADDFNDVKYGNPDVAGPDPLHGTHVGGIVGAIRGNNLGGDGVAENVLLMPVRAVPNGDESDKDIALAIRYAVDNGAKVINMSFGKGFSIHQKEVYEALKYADDHDVLLIHAAGNDAKNLDTESNFPTDMYSFQTEKFKNFLTIGASTKDAKGNLAASFSNYGQTKVDVFAPGFEIYNSVPGNKYKKLQGTSMAAPMVAGAAAMLKSYFPTMTMHEIKNVLLETAKSYKGKMQTLPGSEDTKVDFGTLSVTGAVIDLQAAVKKCIALEKAKK